MKTSRHSLHAVMAVVGLALAGSSAASTGTFLDKWDANDLRVASYNVYWDAIFEDPRFSEWPARFSRVINAVQPDVLALQEIRESAAATAARVNELAPLPGGASWYAHKHSDNVILSRFPFAQTAGGGAGDGGHADALIDLPDDRYAKDLFLISDHWPCCSNETGRQEEADQLVRWLDDARNPGGQITVPSDTPMVVVGDFNLVGSGRPLETLLTGDIRYNGSYGPDSPTDWDGTPMADARPLHNGAGPADYTWRNDGSSFAPGVLDFITYTDSVIDPANRFVLEPATMTAAELAATGLQPYDVQLNESSGWYDHLPVVVDFRFEPLPGDYNGDGRVDTADQTTWAEQFGRVSPSLSADGNSDGVVDAADYTLWRDAHADAIATQAVPEPASVGLAGLVAIGLGSGVARSSVGRRG